MGTTTGKHPGTKERKKMNANLHNCVDTLTAEKRIKVEDYKGFWSVIDSLNGYVLLEHNTYGDETCYLVVKAKDFEYKAFTLKSGEKVIIPFFSKLVNVFETYDDIETCLDDEGIEH
jgi:hypothetical protein